MVTFPFETTALRVVQPIGTFYVAVLPADLLLQVAASHTITATLNPGGIGYTLDGGQRAVQDKRLTQIADYIDRIDSAFPNSIILAANYNIDAGIDQDELEAINAEELEDANPANENVQNREVNPDAPSKSWTISEPTPGNFKLHIPVREKLAAVIDGQHRLFAFAKADPKTRLDMEMICAIFLDLPKPFQAQLFATINSTQKQVDRSLTFELFGYNVEDDPSSHWTPDKFAVFLTRKLSTEPSSPLQGRIVVSPKRDLALQVLTEVRDWRVSTAVVVDGILRLFSSNPKRDANLMRTTEAHPRTALRAGPRDRSPLRDVFVEGNDSLIHKLVENYLIACNNVFWRDAAPDSYIRKTVGVQALFDILRKLAPGAIEAKDARVTHFENAIRPAAAINFAEPRFQSPSGSGRSLIRRTIEASLFRLDDL